MVDKMVKIECLACGGDIKIPANADTEQYDGDGVCEKCKSLIHVKLVKGKVQKYKVVENKSNQEHDISFIIGKGYAKQKSKVIENKSNQAKLLSLKDLAELAAKADKQDEKGKREGNTQQGSPRGAKPLL